MVRLGQALFFAKTVPSEPVRTAHPPREREQVFVLPNPLDLARFEGISDQPPSDPPTILTVGRFMEEKNQTELIEAFALLAADYPTWTLRLVGDGVMREELERVVEKNRLSTRVEMPGATQEVAAEYRAASIVAVPSLYESFGMVTAEAQASGRPVIGFADCSGTNELIENEKNGLLVAGGSARVASLAAGLRRLMDDAALRARLGAAGPRSVDQFSIERVVDVWENFLQACKAGTLYH
ncbi:hypothetical protein N789_03395 [Arenimonas oryziterrae DSM 21050 = YC6267]|uniref:Glycosyl transferase family 1 domain-containing protein n=2 Tax=Arenimonas TaxID=490567 RepID=A0A091BL68_9GAMM|nr:hypothetical protein N789_03395 [Arenimonas oryziterrae DSM 21050 = YC6267]